MATKKTAVGVVDKEVLEKLCNSFDTRKITDAVGDLDYVRGELEEPGGPRNDFFRLKEMAMYLFDEDAPPGDTETIWELADELSSTVSRCREKLDQIEEVLDELTALAPDPDEDEDSVEEADEDDEEEVD